MSRLKDAVLGGLLFGALGPPLGGVLVWLVILINTGWSSDSVFAFFGFVIFSYVFAAIPAVLTGVCAGLLKHRYSRPKAVLCLAILGGLISSMFIALLAARGLPSLEHLKFALLLAAPALPATALLAWFFFAPASAPDGEDVVAD